MTAKVAAAAKDDSSESGSFSWYTRRNQTAFGQSQSSMDTNHTTANDPAMRATHAAHANTRHTVPALEEDNDDILTLSP